MIEEAETGILPARQARSRQTRDRLMAAGLHLIETRGIDDIAVADIARRAKCSVGAFYNRFRDKESFFTAAVEQVLDEERSRARTVLSPENWPDRTAECPAAIVAFAVELVRRRQGLIRAILKRSMSEPVAPDPIGEAGQAVVQAALHLLQERPPTDLADPPEEVAVRAGMQIVLGTLFSAIVTGRGAMAIDDDGLQDWLTYLFHQALARPGP